MEQGGLHYQFSLVEKEEKEDNKEDDDDNDDKEEEEEEEEEERKKDKMHRNLLILTLSVYSVETSWRCELSHLHGNKMNLRETPSNY